MNIPFIYIYNFIFLVLMFSLCKNNILPKKSYRFITVIYFLIIFGQRWFGGVDFYSYLKGYVNGKKFEIGYYCIQEILKKYDVYFGIFIFIIYLFTTLVSIWFIRKYTTSNITLFLFFISEYHIMSLNPLRTYIAINIFLIGYFYYNYKNKKKGLFIILLGTLFHKITIGIILIFILTNLINIIKLRKIINIFLYLLPLLNLREVLRYITYIILPNYVHYFDYDVGTLSKLNIIRYYIVLLAFDILKKYINIKNVKERDILQGMYIFLILIGVASSFAPMHRIAYFYKIFEVIFFAYIVSEKIFLSQKIKRYVIILIFIINYIGIAYKDLGVLFNYSLKPLHLYNIKSDEEYLKEVNLYLKRLNMYIQEKNK